MKKYIGLLAVLISFCSCKDPKPASNAQGPTKINIQGYLGLCEKFHEGSTLSMRARVYRDEYEGNTVVTYNALVHTYYIDNDHSCGSSCEENYIFEDPDGFGIPMSIPDNGSYALRVQITGRDCFSCCNGPACNYNGGEPFYDGARVEINKSYRPSTVYLTPTRSRCE